VSAAGAWGGVKPALISRLIPLGERVISRGYVSRRRSGARVREPNPPLPSTPPGR
jgi:hypothetical protein